MGVNREHAIVARGFRRDPGALPLRRGEPEPQQVGGAQRAFCRGVRIGRADGGRRDGDGAGFPARADAVGCWRGWRVYF